jgi:hypothetical protein
MNSKQEEISKIQSQIFRKEIWKYLNFFSAKINGNRHSPSPSTTKIVESFIIKFGEVNIGPNFLWDYMSFQFCYWRDKNYDQRHRIEVNWILGTKAIERWNNRAENWQYFTQQFLNREQIQNTVKKQCNKVSLTESLETERKRYLNSETGLIYCQIEELTYDKDSESCSQCIYKSQCQSENAKQN